MEATRVDRWLWSVRLYKTRSSATAACGGGHVRVNGAVAKPSTQVRVGDRVEAHHHGRQRILEVVQIIDKRVMIDKPNTEYVEWYGAVGDGTTDDTAACELIAQPVRLVESKEPNPKVTVPSDLFFIEVLLRRAGVT